MGRNIHGLYTCARLGRLRTRKGRKTEGCDGSIGHSGTDSDSTTMLIGSCADNEGWRIPGSLAIAVRQESEKIATFQRFLGLVVSKSRTQGSRAVPRLTPRALRGRPARGFPDRFSAKTRAGDDRGPQWRWRKHPADDDGRRNARCSPCLPAPRKGNHGTAASLRHTIGQANSASVTRAICGGNDRQPRPSDEAKRSTLGAG